MSAKSDRARSVEPVLGGRDDAKLNREPPKLSTSPPKPPPFIRRESERARGTALPPSPTVPNSSHFTSKDDGPGSSPSVPEVIEEESAENSSTEGEDEGEDVDIIDLDTFGQILEMDDEDDREFSQSILDNYFEQAGTTFKEMEVAIESQELKKLSSLGHFLKGSSAALGVNKVQKTCERMQHYGDLRDEEKGIDLTKEVALKLLVVSLVRLKKQYAEAEEWLKEYYGNIISSS